MRLFFEIDPYFTPLPMTSLSRLSQEPWLVEIFSAILHFDNNIRREGWEQFDFFKKNRDDFTFNPLIDWLEQHRYQHRERIYLELLEAPIKHYLSAINNQSFFLSRALQIAGFPTDLINLFYNCDDTLFRINLFLSYRKVINKFINKEDIIWDYIKSEINHIPYKKLNYENFTVSDFFSKNQTDIDLFKKKLHKLHRNDNFEELFNRYDREFYYFHNFFKNDCFKLLYKMLDVDNLYNFTRIAIILYQAKNFFLNEYILHKLAQIKMHSGSTILNILNYLSVILFKASEEENRSGENHFTVLAYEILAHLHSEKPNEKVLLEQLTRSLLRGFAKEWHIPVYRFTESCYTINQLCSLFIAGELYYQDSEYIPIFKILLRRHLYQKSIANCLWNTSQQHEILRQIAINNAKTALLVKGCGIKHKLLFNYPYEQSFVVGGAKTLERNQMILDIWQSIVHLLKNLHEANYDPSQKANAYFLTATKHLDNFIAQINKKRHAQEIKIQDSDLLAFIGNKTNFQLLHKKIKPALEKIIYDPSLINIGKYLFFDINLIVEKINRLDKLITEQHNASDSKGWNKPHFYGVKIWNKTDPQTFFLGDYLGCCLSTSGAYFPALIQRIIDDAMIIVTVMDEVIMEPVAGMWLYLACEGNKVYLISNFTEMRASIANHDPILRDAIIFELLKFTNTFAEHINTKFLLAALNYGCLPNWQFKKQEHQLQKLGTLRLETQSSEFYLKSLNDKSFFHYDEKLIYQLYPSVQQSIVHRTLIKKEESNHDNPYMLSNKQRFFNANNLLFPYGKPKESSINKACKHQISLDC